jgi:hypothetical protein
MTLNHRVFLEVFGTVACLFYLPAYWYDWAPMIYYPLVGEWTWYTHPLPKAEAGPGMKWYGWMVAGACIGLIAATAAAVVPGKGLERFVYRFSWVLPAIAVAISVAMDAYFFFL